MFEDHYSYRTHAQIPATTQAGKSKLTELFCREHYHNGSQVFGIDGKGTTFYGMANFYARIPPKRPCIFIDPNSKVSVPLRFFTMKGGSPGSHASRVAKVILNALGTEQIQDVQRYRLMVNMLATYCAHSGESILTASNLLYFHNRQLCKLVADKCSGQMRNEWLALAGIKSETHWESRTESTRNRLSPFLAIDGLRRLFGLPGGLDVGDALESGANIWANISPSPDFPDEACRIVGGFLTSELKDFALKHATIPHKLYAYLDEVELYQSPDLALLLELGSGAGIRITLIHHHEGQFSDPRLVKTIEKNCRIKFIGAGTTVEEAKRHAAQSHFQELSQRLKKDDRWAFVNEYEEQMVEETSDSTGGYEAGEVGGSSWGSTTRTTSRLVPKPTKVAIGQEDYTLEEKLQMFTVPFLSLKERQFRVLTPDSDTFFDVPDIFDYWTDWKQVVKFMETHGTPNETIDRQLEALGGNDASNSKIKKPKNTGDARR